MSLYAIGDLHLCFGVPGKTMNIFCGWQNYQELIEKNWNELITPEDTIVLAGDISWGMSLSQARADFDFIHRLPGKKIVIKGNHDYWWTTKKKMDDFLEAEGFSSIQILHNNFFPYDERYAICGTRGWVNIPGEKQDEKVLSREVGRLEASVGAAVKAGYEPLVFMHYPPIFAGNFNYDILDVLYRYKVKLCCYGHIHGRSGHNLCVTGTYDDIDFHLISGDYLQFCPQKLM
ncbi:MAG: metallophosphoesterase [Oscillospiraceae bacterium]|nr:metallophosphoesterase [Oscillospiraceae bacterium]